MTDSIPLNYPFTLHRDDIAGLLPHRGAMALVDRIEVLAHDHYVGHSCWGADHPMLQGHFPGCPIVPGVMQLEAAAQLAGAGLLAGDPISRSIGPDHLGMLSAVRKCLFKRPVLPQQQVRFDARCRRMADKAVMVEVDLQVDAQSVATVEFMLAHVPAARLQGLIPAEQLQALLH